MSRGRRYNRDIERKLNWKKVAAVIIAIIVVIMVVIMGKKVLEEKKDSKKITSQTYYTIFDNDKWGVIDNSANIVIDPSYKEMIQIPNNKKDVFLCVYDVDYSNNTYKTKALNSKNEEIFTEYEQIEVIANYDSTETMWYEENVLKVKQDGKYGIIDLSGKVIEEPQYEEIVAITGIENAYKVKKEGKYGIIDNKGTKILPTEYTDITNLGKDNKSGYIVKNEEGKYGIVDYSNKPVIEAKYDAIEKVYGNGLYVVIENGTRKVINKDSGDVLTSGFDNIISISERTGEDAGIIFEKSGLYGFMDLVGTIKIEPTYQELTEGKQGTLIAKKNDKVGIIDISGTEMVSFIYSSITYNKKAELYIAEDEKFNAKILNANYEEKLTGIFIEVNEDKDYIKMRENDAYKYYNFKFEEKSASNFLTENTIFLSKKDGKYGFVDKDGKVIVDYQYDDAIEQNLAGYAAVNKDGKWGCIDATGKVVCEPCYDLTGYLQVDFIGKWHKGMFLNMNYYSVEK